MKKVMMVLAMLTMTLAASAQFEQGKTFVGASLSGFDFSYNGANKLSIGLSAQAGAFVADNWLVYGLIGYDHKAASDSISCATNDFRLGAGGRYYFQQNGVFLGAHVEYVHGGVNYNDFMPGIEVGYCFFLSHNLAIEPALYYNQSFNDHSEYSTVGIKVGLSLYHSKKQLANAVVDALK